MPPPPKQTRKFQINLDDLSEEDAHDKVAGARLASVGTCSINQSGFFLHPHQQQQKSKVEILVSKQQHSTLALDRGQNISESSNVIHDRSRRFDE